jgi:hypothetical protein
MRGLPQPLFRQTAFGFVVRLGSLIVAAVPAQPDFIDTPARIRPVCPRHGRLDVAARVLARQSRTAEDTRGALRP